MYNLNKFVNIFFTCVKIYVFICMLSILFSCGTIAHPPQKVIFETDMCLGVDDAGALAMLHALTDHGETEILAVCFNEVHRSGAAAIDVVNTWYNRGDIPLGIYKGDLENPDTSAYLDILTTFPHDMNNETAPSALDVYLKVLSEQPGKSVIIMSVGFLNNLYDLLTADPELVQQKVMKLIVMGGVINDGFNFVRHNLVNKSEYVIRNWPTPIVITEHGETVLTGPKFSHTPDENPVREAFYRWFDQKYTGGSSWDQMAVLYLSRESDTYFKEITHGKGRLPNGFEWQMKPDFRSYLETRLPDSVYVKVIEDLMTKPPKGE